MIYIILSIFCSVSVGVLLKLARKKEFSLYQIISWNYAFAFLALQVFYTPALKTGFSFDTRIILYSLILLLPMVFVFQAKAIKYSGIVKTDIAQRLSLLLSIGFSFFVANEVFSIPKSLGLLFAFLALFLSFYKKKSAEKISKSNTFYLVLVLLGFGIIDILFKKVASIGDLGFTEILLWVFIGAFAVAVLIVILRIVQSKEHFQLKNSLWGALIGILNFGNISFYIKAHQSLSNAPSMVFVGMNMGVIILGSLVGIFYFKEKISLVNYIGIFLALLAVALLSYAQLG